MGGSGFHFPDVAQELNVRLVESCHLLARLCGDKKVIIWGQGTHLLGMDRFPAPDSPRHKTLNTPAPWDKTHPLCA